MEAEPAHGADGDGRKDLVVAAARTWGNNCYGDMVAAADRGEGIWEDGVVQRGRRGIRTVCYLYGSALLNFDLAYFGSYRHQTKQFLG